MKIYDISQEVFACTVYPGDPQPEKETLRSTAAGDLYNLTSFSMCAHNGTHIDAPFHFLHDGKTVDQMVLRIFVGDCFVARHEGDVTAMDAEEILKKSGGEERILVETDAPFILPYCKDVIQPKLLRRARNTSLILPAVINKIAELKGIPAEEVEQATTENVIRLFNLPINT